MLPDLDAAVAHRTCRRRNAGSGRRRGARRRSANSDAGEVARLVDADDVVSVSLAPVTPAVMPAQRVVGDERGLPFKPIGPAKPTGAPVTRSTVVRVGACATRSTPSASLQLDLAQLVVAAHQRDHDGVAVLVV